jgi:hypothetical protein
MKPQFSQNPGRIERNGMGNFSFPHTITGCGNETGASVLPDGNPLWDYSKETFAILTNMCYTKSEYRPQTSETRLFRARTRCLLPWEGRHGTREGSYCFFSWLCCLFLSRKPRSWRVLGNFWKSGS